MPTVSVVVPNYNHASYLPQRLDSILAQTYQDFELIILDDCSTDQSREVILDYQQHPAVTHIVFNEQNSGSTFKQWIRGIGLASGDYIWIAESDDWCEPSLLETLVQGLEGKPGCVAAYCQSFFIYRQNEIRWNSDYPLLQDYRPGNQFIAEHMLAKNAMFNASMCLFRKTAFERVSPEFTGYRFCGDWLFWIEVCIQGEVSISGKLLNYFRKHDRDVSGKAYASGLNFVEELKLLFSIRSRNLINETQYIETLKAKYHDFRSTNSGLAPDRKREIEDLFFSSPRIKKTLQAYYRRWKFKHTLKTMITGRFSSPQ